MKTPPTLVLIFTCVAAYAFAKTSFAPPSVISTTEAYFPYELPLLDGFVILDVNLSSEGHIEKVDVLRNPGSMVPPAIFAVKGWKFSPASANGGPETSAMTVAFVYRPANYGVKAVPPREFSPVVPPESDHDYVPPGVVAVDYPDYPVNAIGWGSVIIQVMLNDAGEIDSTQVLRTQEPFTKFGLETLKRWRFRPATLHGKPIKSSLAIAFIFQTPSP